MTKFETSKKFNITVSSLATIIKSKEKYEVEREKSLFN